MKSNFIIKTILIRLIKFVYNLDLTPQINAFLTTISSMRKNNGLKYTISYLKTSRLHIVRFICDKPLLSNNSNVSVDKSGFPTKFIYFKKILKKNKQAVLTLLSYSRFLTPIKSELKFREVKLNSITDLYKGKEYTIPKQFIESFVNKFNLYADKPVYSNKDHYVSIKGSPNGKSSYSSL
jgi:hypothetical protein